MRPPLKIGAVVLLLLTILLGACENDIERINMLTDENDTPTVKGKNIKVMAIYGV